MEFQYDVRPRAAMRIRKFYQKVAKKYRHTFDEEDLLRNIFDALFKSHQIEKTLLRRKPTLTRWQKQGWHMANTEKWYYAYTIEGDTITIQDACHAQNMHEEADK